jgi:hypothetical protein
MQKAIAAGGEAAHEIGAALAEKQRDEQQPAARTSPGYEKYIQSKRGCR